MDAVPALLQEISGRLERGETDAAGFLDAFCRFLADQIGCARAGVWAFTTTDHGRVLRCLAMYDRRSDTIVGATDMDPAEVGVYFEHLLRDGVIVADDAATHPATVGFADDYLVPNDVRSILDACFTVNGRLIGAFACEHTGMAMYWSPRQVRRLRAIAARASLVLLKAARSPRDTAPAALSGSGALPHWLRDALAATR